MSDFILWYLLIMAIGLLAFPLAYRLLGSLPDRGWALSKPLGLLLSGYVFWISTTLQINQNTTGGILVGLCVLGGLSIWQGFTSGWKNIWEWFKGHRRNLIVTEILFLLAFGLWAMVRAAGPEIASTEKPMEMAFINAILRSRGFPPSDPWLSGYSISYYYFGYVLVSMIIRLAGTSPNIGFNLAVAMWFALAAVASYGILFNLSYGWLTRTGRNVKHAVWNGFLAPFLLLIVSNMEGIFEILHARGVFWKLEMNGNGTSAFWKWLGLLELVDPPTLPLGWLPERVGGIWWWRASRVVTDTNLAGVVTENIDEFPFFSFFLGDLHPHVLAMPFALLAIGIILNFYLSKGNGMLSGRKVGDWLRQPRFWFGSLIIGALGFLNTWDFPMYVGLAAATYVVLNYQQAGWGVDRIVDFLKSALSLGITGFLFYLPFYLAFRSQAGGVLPSLSLFSRGIYFWIMFGGLLIPIFGWLIWYWSSRTSRENRRHGLVGATIILVGMFLLSYLFGIGVMAAPSWIQSNNIQATSAFAATAQKLLDNAGRFFNLHGSTDPQLLIFGSIAERIKHPGTWITLFGLLFLTWGLLANKNKLTTEDFLTEKPLNEDQREETFALLLVLLGIGLTLVPEFFYLLDQFGYRMNTIFKFYYQSWLMWSLAASFALVLMWNQRGRFVFLLYKVLSILVIAIGFIYPVAALSERFDRPMKDWTLDGLSSMRVYNPDEVLAIEWLRTADEGVVAEAIGGQYSNFARIATHTGLPTVLGWPGHESQWGRTGDQLGSRANDIEWLYGSRSWEEAKSILDQYQIRYVYIGDLERSQYQVEETKFMGVLRVAFQSGRVVIYEYNSLK